MAMPQSPVTLTPEQIAGLNEKLSVTRHDINNNLSLIVAAVELIRRKPEMTPRLLESIGQQPDKIIAQMRAFAAAAGGAVRSVEFAGEGHGWSRPVSEEVQARTVRFLGDRFDA